MAGPERGLLDTSIFIAGESGRRLAPESLPERSAISPITLTELRAGVLAATDLHIQARRLRTLEAVRDIELLAIDAAVADAWALLRVHLARAGRRCNVNDLWIASTALAHGIPVVTQDADFDPLDGVAGLSVLQV